MNLPDSAREALFVEALGGMAQLIDRLQLIAPAIDESRQALVDAHAELGDELANRLSSFALQMNALAESAKSMAAKAVVAQVDAASRRTLDGHKRELAQAAQDIFAEQVKLAIQGLSTVSRGLAEQEKRAIRKGWLAYGVTGCATFVATFMFSWTLWSWTAGH